MYKTVVVVFFEVDVTVVAVTLTTLVRLEATFIEMYNAQTGETPFLTLTDRRRFTTIIAFNRCIVSFKTRVGPTLHVT